MNALLRRPAAGLGLLANAAAAAGVLFFGLGWYELLLVYYVEILLVGGYNVLRIFVAGVAGEPLGRFVDHSNRLTVLVLLAVLVIVFVAKFGGFVLGLGFFFAVVPGFLAEAGGESEAVWRALADLSDGVAWYVGFLAAAHGVAFVGDFLIGGEYRRATVLPLLLRPYLRLLGLAAAVVVALAAAASVAPSARVGVFVAVLLGLKASADLGAYALERRGRDEAVAPALPGVVLAETPTGV